MLLAYFPFANKFEQPDGDTPLYDSLSVAHSMLQSFKAQVSSTRSTLLSLFYLSGIVESGLRITDHMLNRRYPVFLSAFHQFS